MSRAQPSTLHLQMGQEVMYLLLVTSLICNVILAAIAMRSSTMIAEVRTERAALAVLAQDAKTLEDERSKSKALETQVKRLESERAQLIARGKELEASLQKLPIQPRRPDDQPPIITLREADGFSFAPGSAEITPAFLTRLAQEIVPKLAALGDRYGAQIVEVIGHTDGTSIRDVLRVKANLDDFLGQYLDAPAAVAVFPYDNVGLGISRAASVARALRESGLPAKFDIQPLSAAYLIAPNGRTAPAPRKIDDPARRRIEIRIRRVGATRNE